MSIISVTLKAVDQYSSVLTGLNQGWELMSKALGLVKSAADTAFAAINSGVELAAKGGTYAEMRRQFNNVADSFDVDGQSILDNLDKITLNMVKMEDAAKLAGKGITAGLSEEQIGAVFEFVKRRTELTGESFESMSEQVFKALSGGRVSILNQMGLVIERGSDMASIINAISDATAQYGNAGFNAADKMNALTNQQERFRIALGVAINETPAFQRILTGFTDTIITLVDSFDPRPVTEFFEAMSEVGVVAFDALKDIIPGLETLYDGIKDFFETTVDGTSIASGAIVEAAFGIVRGIAVAINTVLDVLEGSGIITAVEYLTRAVIFVVRGTMTGILELIGTGLELAARKIGGIIRSIDGYAAQYPRVAQLLGIEQGRADWWDDLASGAANFADSFAAIDKVFEGVDQAVQGVAEGLKFGRIDLDAIDDIGKRMSDKIGDIDFSKSWGEALSRSLTVDRLELPDFNARGKIDWDESEVKKDFDLRAKEIEFANLDRDKVAEQWARVNWPAEFEALGQFIFEWTLARARDEEVPLAITTAGM